MKFCSCGNMIYVATDKQNNLLNHCVSCGFKEVVNSTQESICVLDDNTVNDDILYAQYLNKYIKFDPTLPRVNNIHCPNPHCTKPEADDHEVIYMKYDFANMKYLYHCCHCNQFWRTSS